MQAATETDACSFCSAAVTGEVLVCGDSGSPRICRACAGQFRDWLREPATAPSGDVCRPCAQTIEGFRADLLESGVVMTEAESMAAFEYVATLRDIQDVPLPPPPTSCAFCGYEGARLFVGPTICICEGCVIRTISEFETGGR